MLVRDPSKRHLQCHFAASLNTSFPQIILCLSIAQRLVIVFKHFSSFIGISLFNPSPYIPFPSWFPCYFSLSFLSCRIFTTQYTVPFCNQRRHYNVLTTFSRHNPISPCLNTTHTHIHPHTHTPLYLTYTYTLTSTHTHPFTRVSRSSQLNAYVVQHTFVNCLHPHPPSCTHSTTPTQSNTHINHFIRLQSNTRCSITIDTRYSEHEFRMFFVFYPNLPQMQTKGHAIWQDQSSASGWGRTF